MEGIDRSPKAVAAASTFCRAPPNFQIEAKVISEGRSESRPVVSRIISSERPVGVLSPRVYFCSPVAILPGEARSKISHH